MVYKRTMEKTTITTVFFKHFVAWFIALPFFAYVEWRHPGFVTYLFPFPVLLVIPGLFLLLEGIFVKRI